MEIMEAQYYAKFVVHLYICVCVGIKNIKFELNIRLPIKASNLYLHANTNFK